MGASLIDPVGSDGGGCLSNVDQTGWYRAWCNVADSLLPMHVSESVAQKSVKQCVKSKSWYSSADREIDRPM
jgi:hypothetical protein